MNFVKVTATRCTQSGDTRGQFPKEFYINIDLIGGFMGKDIIPKSGEYLIFGGANFKDIKLVEDINPKDL
ncbi:hypothetical protein EKM02_12510 [Flavobacterium sp. RSP49]|uniref:hypothetical protein n=1 Tax=Flavobacterium sp. RSP49 TaxID=2497487 RepID=UPI000F81654C|nr:hypothetical protein [Flavobacterium sp. RSP49]RTY98059.1 hypothetical protein EKM02_12510 [Flavobacterium sp. RSP49]